VSCHLLHFPPWIAGLGLLLKGKVLTDGWWLWQGVGVTRSLPSMVLTEPATSAACFSYKSQSWSFAIRIGVQEAWRVTKITNGPGNKISPRLLPVFWLEDGIERAVDIFVIVPWLVLMDVGGGQTGAGRGSLDK
jgi:hypothetical protein